MKPVKVGEIEVPQNVHQAMLTVRHYAGQLKKQEDAEQINIIICSSGKIDITADAIVDCDTDDELRIPGDIEAALSIGNTELQEAIVALEAAKKLEADLPKDAAKTRKLAADDQVKAADQALTAATEAQAAAQKVVDEWVAANADQD